MPFNLDIPELIAFLGYPGLTLIVFAESGFLLGAVLPGDSLLFTAGILASRGALSIVPVVILSVMAAIAGDSFGYWTGKNFGTKLFSREESFFFRKEYVTRTEKFYEKHGKKTLVLARFIPVVRTFAPIFAGIGAMEYRTFLAYNALGGVLWAAGFSLAGYFLGNAFPQLEEYLTFIILGLVFLSLLPVLYEFVSAKLKSRKI